MRIARTCGASRRLPAVLPVLAALLAVMLSTPLPARAAAEAAPAWPHVTVERKDGSLVRDVTLAWVLDGFLLEATAGDGSVTTLAPSQVRAVLAADGRDVTDEVGAACPARDVDFRLLGSRARRPFLFALMGDAGVGVAVGNSPGGGDPVPVLLGGLRVAVAGPLHVRLGLRRQDLEQAAGTGGGLRSSAGTDLLLLLGGRLRQPRDNDNFAYLEGGVLLARFDERFAGDDGGAVSDERSAAGVLAQGGVVLPLSPTRGVDVGLALMSRPPLIAGTGSNFAISLNLALTLRGGGRTESADDR